MSASVERRCAATSARTGDGWWRNSMWARFIPSHELLAGWPNWISFFRYRQATSDSGTSAAMTQRRRSRRGQTNASEMPAHATKTRWNDARESASEASEAQHGDAQQQRDGIAVEEPVLVEHGDRARDEEAGHDQGKANRRPELDHQQEHRPPERET